MSLPPNGTYRLQSTAADFEALGASPSFAGQNAGTWTWTFADDTWTVHLDPRSDSCSGTSAVVGDVVRLTKIQGAGCGTDYDIRWHLDGNDLVLELVALGPGMGSAIQDERTLVQRTRTKIQ